MLERLLDHMLAHSGVVVEPCEAVVDDFRARYPFATYSKFPFDREFH
jgi:peptidoglycan-N-acetylglucosamine deacetylase